MGIFSLDRLVGPGRSRSEDFELLCLELVRARGEISSDAYRIASPDGGIDIYDPERRLAYQCKAYPVFRNDLVRAVRVSACAAKRSNADFPFRAYVLMIPFVPTKEQRVKLTDALAKSEGQVRIIDADNIETRLYDSPKVAARFFPSILVLIPPQCPEIVLKTGDSPTIHIRLASIKTGQQIPIRVSADALVIGLRHFIIALLRLPDTYSITAASSVSSGEIQWALSVVRGGSSVLLPDNVTLADAGVRDGEILHLFFENRATIRGSFLKTVEPHRTKIKIRSAIWEPREMNEAIILEEVKDGSVDLQRVVEAYVSWHVRRVISAQEDS